MNKILICGYYGFKNLGDEALLKVMNDTILAIDPQADVEALTYDINYTTTFLGIKGFSRESVFSMVKKIKSVDVVLFGGGSLIQDATSSKSLLYYLGMMYLSKVLGKKVGIVGNGYGPVTKPFNKWLVKRVLNKLDGITIRDQEEFNELRSLGVSNNMKLASDLALMLQPDAQEGKKVLEQFHRDSDKAMVGISLRPWNLTDEFYEAIVTLAKDVHARGYDIVFIPMQQNIDVDVCNKVRKELSFETYMIDYDIRPEVMAGVISHFDHLIGMRLHALIFGAIQDIPLVGIEYNPKIRTFIEDCGQVLMGEVSRLSSENVLASYDAFNQSKEHYKQQVKAYKVRKKDYINVNYKLIDEMIKSHE